MTKPSKRYQTIAKIPSHFYLKLILLSLILAFICSIGLFFEYQWLKKYEISQPESAAMRYIQALKDKDYTSIYQQASKVESMMNTQEEVQTYLFDKYQYIDLDTLYYSEDLTCNIENESLHCFNIKDDSGTTVQTIYVHDIDGQWLVSPQIVTDPYTIIVPNELLSVELNDITVTSDANKNENDIFYQNYSTLKDTSKLTKYPNYKVRSVISDKPGFLVNDPAYLAVNDPINRYVYVGKKAVSKDLENYEDLILNAAQMYCQFITEDISLWQFMNILYPYSTFYDDVRTFENIWFSDHSAIDFTNVNISDVIEFDDTGFMGNISLDYTVTMLNGGTKTYHASYQISFINSWGNYKVTNIVSINNA